MPRVRTGIDVLLEDSAALLGRKVGLLTNSAGITGDLRLNRDALIAAGVQLVRLFSPEHGLMGGANAGIHTADATDPRTGLPVFSLYGEHTKPTAEMLSGLDVLLFDLQDVGARFYTYTSTLGLSLEACSEHGVKCMVLDRPNPIRGDILEGPLLRPGQASFIGRGPIPIRYGLTIGELSLLYNALLPAPLPVGDGLEVIRLRGWTRDMWFDQTGLPWAPPSPNIPHAHTTIFYPGIGVAGEGARCSAGAGTQLPFECFGAPWMDADRMTDAMNRLALPGVRFRPHQFTPTNPNYDFAGQVCGGLQLHLTNRNDFRPLATGLHLLAAVAELYPERFQLNEVHFNRLMGRADVGALLADKIPVDEWMRGWAPELREFGGSRAPYLLYA